MKDTDSEDEANGKFTSNTTEETRTCLNSIQTMIPQVYHGLLENLVKYVLVLENNTGNPCCHLKKVMSVCMWVIYHSEVT